MKLAEDVVRFVIDTLHLLCYVPYIIGPSTQQKLNAACHSNYNITE